MANENNENPPVKLLVKSQNATSNGGFLKMEKSYKDAKELLLNGTRGAFKLDPSDKNYTFNGTDLIRKPSA